MMELTHIYYNPKSGNVSDTPQEGYMAFVNAKDVAREREERRGENVDADGMSAENEAMLYRDGLDAVIHDLMHTKVDKECAEQEKTALQVFMMGLALTLIIDKYALVIAIVNAVLFTGLMIRCNIKANRMHKLYNNARFGGIKRMEEDDEDPPLTPPIKREGNKIQGQA